MATETLRLLLPRMSEERESAMIQAVGAVASGPRPSLGKVVRHLEQADDPASKNLGAVMRSISEMRLARLCFAPSGGQQIDAEGWTTVFTLGGLTLPDTAIGRDDYSYEQRLSVALLYLVSQFARRLLNGMDRRMPKAIFLDEAWAITATPEGAKLVPEVSRMGRSRNTALILVSQNARDLLNEQVTNCISSVFAFRSSERAEVESVMSLLGVEASEEHKAVLRGLGNGESIFRDLDGRAGRIGIDLASDQLQRWLDTNPTRSRPGEASRQDAGHGQRRRPRPGTRAPETRARKTAEATSRPPGKPRARPPRDDPTTAHGSHLMARITLRWVARLLIVFGAVLAVPVYAAMASASAQGTGGSAAVATAASTAAANSPGPGVQAVLTAAHSADARILEPQGVCQVPGIGDIGGLFGLCNAGSSGLIGDLNNVCQPSLPQPEPANGGIDALIRPPAGVAAGQTLYDSYGVAGQSWAAHGLQCSDMTSLIGNNVAGMVFDAAKSMDRVTITVYQSAAGNGILNWLQSTVDRLISALGNAIYFPYLAPVVILGAIWLAWHGLIRKRATRTIEGTLWMVVACAAAVWLIGQPPTSPGWGRPSPTASPRCSTSRSPSCPARAAATACPSRAETRRSPRRTTASPRATAWSTATPTNCGRSWSASRGWTASWAAPSTPPRPGRPRPWSTSTAGSCSGPRPSRPTSRPRPT